MQTPDFGPDTGPDFRSMAAQIKALETSALTPAQQSDVLAVIDYVRDQTIKLFDATLEREQALARREVEIAAREKDVELKLAAFRCADKTRATAAARILRYLKK